MFVIMLHGLALNALICELHVKINFTRVSTIVHEHALFIASHNSFIKMQMQYTKKNQKHTHIFNIPMYAQSTICKTNNMISHGW
jgi:hypothetical protein